MLEISIFTNVHGQRNYGLVLSHGETGAVELLLEPFDAFPSASPEARKTRIRWVRPAPAGHDGPGTRIEPLNGQRINWQTPEIRQLVAGGKPPTPAQRKALYEKYMATSYE